MTIFKNNKSSITRLAFILQKSHKKYSQLEEASSLSTSVEKHQMNDDEPPTTNTNGRRRRSRVTFREKASVREVVRAKDLAEDPNELWFQETEYKRINQKALSIVRAIDKEAGYHREGKRLCARGLESHLASSRGSINMIRNEAWSSVFEEQSMQSATGEKYNVEKISNVYMGYAIESQIAAHERGVSDALEGKKYLTKSSTRRQRQSRVL
jgi:hypothetical protein